MIKFNFNSGRIIIVARDEIIFIEGGNYDSISFCIRDHSELYEFSINVEDFFSKVYDDTLTASGIIELDEMEEEPPLDMHNLGDLIV